MDLSVKNTPRNKLRLHITLGSLILITFILTITRIADSGTPAARTNTWGVAVCLKAAVFMAYQVVTAHVERFKKWANTKVNVVLNVIDTVFFWFALIIISGMGAAGSRSTSSRALGAIIVILFFILCGFAGLLSFICIRERSYYRAHGVLPGQGPKHAPGFA